MAVKDLTEAQRLDALSTLLREIAMGISGARDCIIESEASPATAYLVCDALGRLGWMADQGCVIAGASSPPICGDAKAWMMSPAVLKSIGECDPANQEAGHA